MPTRRPSPRNVQQIITQPSALLSNFGEFLLYSVIATIPKIPRKSTIAPKFRL